MNKKIKGLNITEIILSIISIILLLTALKLCEAGMKCRPFTFIYIGLLGANIVIQILYLIFKKKELSILPALIIPIGMTIDKELVGLCKKVMRCHTITYPSIVIITTILTILNIVLIILNYKKRRGTDEETD